MVANIIEPLGEFTSPGGLGLSGPAINQVESEAREERRGEPHGGQRFDDRMLAAERLQVKVVQRLDTDRKPVDAGRTIAAKTLRFDAGRIGFQRDLRVLVEAPGGCDRVDDALHRLGAHERRRSAAKEYRAHRPARRESRPMGNLRLKGREIASLVDRRAAHVAVEVAIRTFRQAEGPMDIDPKSRIGGRGPVGARGGRDDATNSSCRYASEPGLAPARGGLPSRVTTPHPRSRRCECASPARSEGQKSCRRRSGRCAQQPGSPRSSDRHRGR